MAYADVVFTGGVLFSAAPISTGGALFYGPGDLAVRDGRILAVGGDLSELIGPRTARVGLAGRLLIPGFQDAHVHAVMGGVELGQCDLSGTVSVEEYRRRIRTYADRNPTAPWIAGGGWSMESFAGGVPDRLLLDDVVPDRPVFLMNRDHHAAWVNTRALSMAGIDASTPDPADGRISRDESGAPVGALQEGAMVLVSGKMPALTAAERLAGLERAQTYLHSLGITAWQDAMLRARNGYPAIEDAYVAMALDGTLTATVAGALWWDRSRGLDQLGELIAARVDLSVGNLRCDTVKLMLDGVAENYTAAMTAPYRDACGHPTANTGLSFIDPSALKTYVTAIDAAGFQAHFHALGDRAVREALDAVAAARAANGRRDTRPHLAHLQVVHPDDVPRFAALGATATMQPLWAVHEPQMDELTLPFLDPALAGWQYPFGDLQKAGTVLAAGSDWPVSSPDPLLGIHAAVNRVFYGEDRESFLPGQRLDLASALSAYTAGSAYVNHLDHTGSLLPGFRADLCVLSSDPFAGAPLEIGGTTAERTYVEGSLVYAR